MVYQRAVSLFLCRKYRSDISGITTKAPCEAALMGERHVRIEISDFVMRTFVLMQEISHSDISEVSTKAACSMPAMKGEGARRNHSACFGRVLQSFFLKNSGLGL